MSFSGQNINLWPKSATGDLVNWEFIPTAVAN